MEDLIKILIFDGKHGKMKNYLLVQFSKDLAVRLLKDARNRAE